MHLVVYVVMYSVQFMYGRYLCFRYVSESSSGFVGSTIMLDFITFISISDRVAAERWCAGLFCVLLSHHLCGFDISYAVLGTQVGFPVPRHLCMTSCVSFRN